MNRKEFCKYNLARQMEKKLDFLIETEQAAVMKDAYPKAQYHFLVVAKEQISGVTKLTRDHLPLLDHMMELANQIIEQQHHLPPDNFLVGFKIDAFMNSLCMHVISDDFYSISMRKLKHWNSFNTDLFLTYQAVYALLRLQGSIESMFDEKALELRETKQLHCNQCDFECDSLLFLKAHLHEHWKKREDDFEVKKQVEQITKMLDDSKLSESPTKIPQVEEEAKSKTVSTNWRQNPEQKSTNNEFDTKVPTTNWRQNKNQSVTEQTPIVAYQNEFAKHFQKSMERQQQRQQAVNAMQGQGLMGPRPPCVPPPYYAQQAQAFRPRLPHMVNNSINQMQSTDSPPHFNPFRQPPNMGQVGPNPYNIRNGSLPQNINFERKPNWTPRPQYNQGQNKFKNAREVNSTPIEKKPNDAMENKPNAKPKPQYNQAQNRPNNTRDNSTPMTTQPNDAMENKPKWKGKPQHKQGQNKNVNNNQPNAGPSNKPNWKPKPSNTSPNVPKQTQPDQKQNNPNSANSQTPN